MYDITAAPIVRYVRERAALTQRELAERAGTTQAVVSRIESGDTNPSVETLRRVVEAAGFQLQLKVVERRVSDPVVDAYKPGVDQTLLIDNLRETPRGRIARLMGAMRFAVGVQEAGRESRRKVAESARRYGK